MKTNLTKNPAAKNASIGSYQIGFVLSILLTLAAFALATHRVPVFIASLSAAWIVGVVIALAFIQFLVQLVFFLHLGEKEEGSRDKMVIFVATLCVVVILVGGSLWIMNTLNTRMMPDAAQMTQYMQDQAGM